MRALSILPLVLLAGCATYQLGYLQPQPDKTDEQRDTAVLICKDRAKMEANTDARVAASFVAGLTIIGAPIAIAEERRKQREVFALCMSERGFTVTPPQ